MSGWQSWVCAASAAAVLLGTERTGHADSVTLFAITFDNELISVDPTSGTGTLIGYLESPMAAFGLADRGGDLWTFDQHGDLMVRLSPSSGATLETVDIGVQTSGEGGVTFRSDGVGFLVRRWGTKGALWSFDVTTVDSANFDSPSSTATLIGPIGFDSVSGLSFLPTAAIPVPAAAWMGLILLGMLRAVKASWVTTGNGTN